MKFLWRLGSKSNRRTGSKDGVSYESVLTVRSKSMPGVTFVLNRVSFGRRMELSRQIREISRRGEFLEAGSQVQEKIEANILAQEVDGMYLRWGLVSIEGMRIDGEPASAGQLIDRGPEELTREIVGAIKEQCGLSDTERKN